MTLMIDEGVSARHSDADTASPATGRAALIKSVGVTVEAYLGDRAMTIAEINALDVGSVISLDAALNALVEVRVNGVRIARGELVAVGDKFGVRLTAVAQ